LFFSLKEEAKMSKRLIVILALAFVVSMTAAVYAEVQNVKVGGDLLIRGVARYDYPHTVSTGDVKEKGIISSARIRLDADLTDNVSATVRLLNERFWGEEGDAISDTDISLDLAYMTLKEFLYSPLTLVVGRQELRYGNALIIGDGDGITNTLTPLVNSTMGDLSLRKAFDAAKAILNYDPLVIDLVYAKTEENVAARNDDVDLMGVNASYKVNADLLTEAYFWSRNRNYGSTGLTANIPGNDEKLNTIGARAAYSGIKNLNLGLEVAYQFGDHLASATLYPDEQRTPANKKAKVDAYAIQFISSYAVPMRFNPVVGFSYTRLSGDKDLNTGDNYRGWSPMYEDQAGGTIFNRILGYSNAQLFNLNGTAKPTEDVTVKLDYYHIRLLNTFSTYGGNITRTLSGISGDGATTIQSNERHLADELDLSLMYDYTEDVQLGLSTGMYFPGTVYDRANDAIANQVIGSMKVTF